MSAERVLVTGATGFIGRHAIGPLLERGLEVHATFRGSSSDLHEEARWHRVDLLADGGLESVLRSIRPSRLLHFAWVTEHGRYWSAPENRDWVEAGVRLFSQFAAAGGERATIAGTCAEYDWSTGVCVEGETPIKPRGAYGQAKHELHERLSTLASTSGAELGWGRIFFVFGPHEHPDRLVASVIRSVLAGEEALCTDGEQMRDFMHSSDVAAAFVELLLTDTEGPVNIASGSPVSVRELVTVIGDLAGRPDLIRLGAVPRPADDPPKVVGDTARLREEVGWSPTLTLEKAIESTIDWWRRRLDRDDG